MFTPWRFSVGKELGEGRNIIAVSFKPIHKAALELMRKYGGKYGSLHAKNFSARPYVRKAQYSSEGIGDQTYLPQASGGKQW